MALHDNLIFTGFGMAIPEYKVTTQDLERKQESGWLDNFDLERVVSNPKYQTFRDSRLARGEDHSPLSWFIEETMGFKERYHVAPFPPTKRDMPFFASTELAVKAITEALEEAHLEAKDVDAWFVATMSCPYRAPGIACVVKDYFLGKGSHGATFSLTSSCAGFSLALHQAYCFMKVHKGVKNVVVCHTDTISRFLAENMSLIPLATFGDGAGAVVLSRHKSYREEGLLDFHSLQEPAFMEAVSFNDGWSLDYSPSDIRHLAIAGISEAVYNLFKHELDIDLLVPHQTGNLIIDGVAKKLGVPDEKVFKDVQRAYGNVSGATIPVSLHWLARAEKLIPGQNVLTATAGTGGEFNGFLYRVPKQVPRPTLKSKPLAGKTYLVTGATGGIGHNVVEGILSKGGDVVALHNNSDKFKVLFGERVVGFCTDMTDMDQVAETVKKLDMFAKFDGVIHCATKVNQPLKVTELTPETLGQSHALNALAPFQMILALLPKIGNTLIYLGSASEEHPAMGASAITSSKLALRGFAVSLAPELAKRGIRSIYYMLGLVDSGSGHELNEFQKTKVMKQFKQKEILAPEAVATRIVQSLISNRVFGTMDKHDNQLLIRKDGFQ